MNHAVTMSGNQGIDNLGRERQQPAEGKAAARNDQGECPSIQILHRHEERAVVAFDGVDGDDIGMIQCGDDLRFTLEAFEPSWIAGDFAGEELQSHLTFEAAILREVDIAHSAMAQRLCDAIVTEGLAYHDRAPIIPHASVSANVASTVHRVVDV